jgi:DNA-directed RNA polymerase subunit H (RpoH/RPB5)
MGPSMPESDPVVGAVEHAEGAIVKAIQDMGGDM